MAKKLPRKRTTPVVNASLTAAPSLSPMWDALDPNWSTYSERVGKLKSNDSNSFPNFLIIGPPKTGTTWIADALRTLEDFFIPEKKELHYFDCEWNKIELREYLDFFSENAETIKGEATPNYAFLPPHTIATIAKLNPKLKIAILVRNPVDRALSQLNHCIKYREDTFRNGAAGSTPDITSIIRHLISDYSRAGNDYLAILARWAQYFPRDSMFVDYFESATADPVGFFERLVRFLAGKRLSFSEQYDLTEPRNVGETRPTSATATRLLKNMYAPSMERIAAKLLRDYGLKCPWSNDHIEPYQWPIWIRDIGQQYRILLDRELFIGVEMRRGRVIARHSYLGEIIDLLTAPTHQKLRHQNNIRAMISTRGLIRINESINLDRLNFHRDGKKSAPELVGDHRGYNIVRLPDGYLALRKSLGEVIIDRDPNDIVRKLGFSNAVFGRTISEALAHIEFATFVREFADVKATLDNLPGTIELLRAQVREALQALQSSLNGTSAALHDELTETSHGLNDLSERTANLEKDMLTGATALQRSVLALSRRIKD